MRGAFKPIAVLFAAAVLALPVRAAEPTLDTAAIESITGLSGTYDAAQNVFRISKPRTDVQVSIGGWALPPFMGLTSYAAFLPMAGGTLLTGDIVLLEDEVNPAISAALDAGLEVTALRNQFFFDQPRVCFMHIGGTGETARMAAGVKAIYDRISHIRAARNAPASAFAGDVASPSDISAAPIEDVFGMKAERSAGMVRVTMGRVAWMRDVEVGSEMGFGSSAAFAGSDQQAVVVGDFAMVEGDLQIALKTLRRAGIDIVAIHQYATAEVPRHVFLHYWGKGPALELARAVKKALDTQQPTKYD